MDTRLLHVRDKLELIIRFMMAGDGSFRARLSEAYRHPQFGLRKVPIVFLPPDLQKDFSALLEKIDKNENSRVLNTVKMELMDEVFFFYKKVCDLIFKDMMEEKFKAAPRPAAQEDGLIDQIDVVPAKNSKKRSRKNRV